MVHSVTSFLSRRLGRFGLLSRQNRSVRHFRLGISDFKGLLVYKKSETGLLFHIRFVNKWLDW